MKTLSQFLGEGDNTDKVYVIKDAEGQLLGVAETEKDAKNIQKQWNKESKANGATVEPAPRKDYIKD